MGSLTGQPLPHGMPAAIDIASRQFGEQEVALFADLTDDRNPIHHDKVFASKTPFGYPIVFGFLFVMPVWPALKRALGRDALISANVNIRFLSPVFVGRTVDYAGRLVDTAADNATYEVTIRSERDRIAAIVTAVIPVGNIVMASVADR